ncbi:MAG: ATP-grasp domain-containing protein [Gemmatimonadota bacterium]|nr:MAG: ATP-grasp domain-containing protein [Gemmatimonadota bacterium]
MTDETAAPTAAHEPTPPAKPKSVIVLYNQVGEDWYEKLQQVDPSTLPFEPEYPVHVPTVREEYGEVARALRRSGYRARAVNLENDLRRLERVLKRNRPDVIFNLVEFFHDDAGLEAAIAGMYDVYRIAYTGAAPFALSLCQDKGLTKRVLQDHRVPTPRFKVFYEPKLPKRLGLRYPIIVKPVWEDASAGVSRDSVFYEPERLEERVGHVYREYGAIIIEEFIEGRELHVSVWGNDPPEVLPPVEFDFSELPPEYPPIITYSAKWNPLSEVYHKVHTICPAPLPERLLRRVEDVAIRAYRATECRDYARLDIRLKGDKPYVLEVNPNPDLTEGVSFMDSAEQAGYSFDAALAQIVELAGERRPALVPPAEVPGERRPGEDLGLFPKIETPPADPEPGPPPATEK